MIIVTSAAYVGQEFQAELGRIPPVFLPVGNRRLFEHQLDILSKTFPKEKIALSIPESFIIGLKDIRILENFNVEIIAVPECITLADSLLFVINSISRHTSPIRILHGDTLILDIPKDVDILGISKTFDNYRWEVDSYNNIGSVWCGYFSFSNIEILVNCLDNAHGNFVKAVRKYDAQVQLHHTNISSWYDFGHINTYFKSRSKITTEREFNSLSIDNNCLLKTGFPAYKIVAEYKWFQNLPKDLKVYTPQLVDQGNSKENKPFYVLEYLCILPLNELYVHGRNPYIFWERIFRHCASLLKKCASSKNEVTQEVSDIDFYDESYAMIATKTKQRVMEFAVSSGIDLDSSTSINGQSLPSINKIIEECIELTNTRSIILGVMHGDLCLSNILYDARADLLKVIDPRALDSSGKFSMLGDLRYDLAKLSHSIIGLYDHIISGSYECQYDNSLQFKLDIYIDSDIKKIQKKFEHYPMIGNIRPVDVMPITILLFFAMLPLHSDRPDRQFAFIANALRLYSEYIRVDEYKEG